MDLITNIKEHIASLKSNGLETAVTWAPGHTVTENNEHADKLRKKLLYKPFR